MSEKKSEAVTEQLLLKPVEAAKALKCGTRKLWELTNRKLIPHVRIGRLVRYSPERLRAWIASQTIGELAC